MAFLAGMGGFLTALAVFAAGVWVGKIASRSGRVSRPTMTGDIITPEEQRQREFYNFLHYDGGRMPSATDTKR